jgi:hypothetical protein
MPRISRGRGTSRKVQNLTKTWERQARKIINDGVKNLRTRINEATTLAETTAEVAKLHVTVKRNQINRFKVLYDLGKAVWDAFPSDDATRELHLTDHIIETAHRMRSLDEESRSAEGRISSRPMLRL